MSGAAKAAPARRGRRRRSRLKTWQWLGPGLITGASDDDPSGIATYSQVGAQFGYGMSWVMLFSFPLMAAIQEVSAWIGRSVDRGSPATSGSITRSGWCEVIVFLLVVANIINLGAMGEATEARSCGARTKVPAVLPADEIMGLERQ